MSILEWICESYNPGNVGDCGSHDNQRTRTRGGALLTGLLALAVCLLPLVLVYQKGDDPLHWLAILLAGEAIYIYSFRIR
jgi:hypothetical protein